MIWLFISILCSLIYENNVLSVSAESLYIYGENNCNYDSVFKPAIDITNECIQWDANVYAHTNHTLVHTPQSIKVKCYGKRNVSAFHLQIYSTNDCSGIPISSDVGHGISQCIQPFTSNDMNALKLSMQVDCTKAVDCILSDWGEWSDCSATCGPNGYQSRQRLIKKEPSGSGKLCDKTIEYKKCTSLPDCRNLECQSYAWSTWSQCSAACGMGNSTRTRQLSKPEAKHCPISEEAKSCKRSDCIQDCKVSTWSKWSTCSKSCGTGTMKRQRTILKDVKGGGLSCPKLEEERVCNSQGCDQDCEVSKWSDWQDGTQQCHIDITGLQYKQYRTREVTKPQLFNGKACPSLYEEREHKPSRACMATSCFSSFPTQFTWSKWSNCSQTCGGGIQTRQVTNIDINQVTNNNAECPQLKETRKCNMLPCPHDCEVSTWSPLSKCSLPCGGGTQIQSRTITKPQMNGGKACPLLEHTQHCNYHDCPVDCKVSKWSKFSSCSSPCGEGSMTRKRTIIVSPRNGGSSCPPLEETLSCYGPPCKFQSDLSVWTPFSNCSQTCGGGQWTRTRQYGNHVKNPPKDVPLKDTASCNTIPCPTDCKVGNWGSWSACSASCDGGSQFRTREVIEPDTHGGKICPTTLEIRECNKQPCHERCEYTAWGEWSACSKTCDGGTQVRRRAIIKSLSDNDCKFGEQEKTCNTQPCPVNCEMSEWSDFSDCSSACGKGISVRSRQIIKKSRNGGEKCGATVMHETCEGQHECDKDCKLSPWSEWSECTSNCGEGVRKRTRKVIQEASGNGKKCLEALEQELHCGSKMSCTTSEHCSNDWSTWSTCSKSCGSISGVQTRTRHGGNDKICGPSTLTRACNYNKTCDGVVEQDHLGLSANTSATKSSTTITNTNNNPTDINKNKIDHHSPHCQVSEWSDWSNCSSSCSHGVKARQRSILKHPTLPHGNPCPSLIEEAYCFGTLCGEALTSGLTKHSATNYNQSNDECLMSKWGKWSECSVTCGIGAKTRNRTVLEKYKPDAICPNTTEISNCSHKNILGKIKYCGGDCVMSDWSDWTNCTKRCGGGTQKRNRTILLDPLPNGKPCGNLTEERKCNTDKCTNYDCFFFWFWCAKDCVVSNWTDWSECESDGFRTRTRKVLINETAGGVCDKKLVDRQPCPCHVSEWSEWSDCSCSCDGKRRRQRKALGKVDEKSCPLEEVQSCNQTKAECCIPCKVSPWSDWSACSMSCGGGFKTRIRELRQAHPLDGGDCGLKMQETVRCNNHNCTCKYQDYGPWSGCHRRCGDETGSEKGIRERISQPTPDSPALCDRVVQQQECVVSPYGGVIPFTDIQSEQDNSLTNTQITTNSKSTTTSMANLIHKYSHTFSCIQKSN